MIVSTLSLVERGDLIGLILGDDDVQLFVTVCEVRCKERTGQVPFFFSSSLDYHQHCHLEGFVLSLLRGFPNLRSVTQIKVLGASLTQEHFSSLDHCLGLGSNGEITGLQ